MILKILVLSFLVGVVVIVGIGGLAYFQMKSMEPPSKEDAPWALQTYSQDGMLIPSRVFYTSEIEIVDHKPIMSIYWSKDGEKYKKHSGTKELPENTKILRR